MRYFVKYKSVLYVMVQQLNFIRNPIKLNANLVYIIFE